MKGFETICYEKGVVETTCKKECPAMKGFETLHTRRQNLRFPRKKECPAMKGFETSGIYPVP